MFHIASGSKNHTFNGAMGGSHFKAWEPGHLRDGNVRAGLSNGDDRLTIRRRANASGSNTMRLNGKEGFDVLRLYGARSDWKKSGSGWKNTETGDIVKTTNIERVRFSGGHREETTDGPTTLTPLSGGLVPMMA